MASSTHLSLLALLALSTHAWSQGSWGSLQGQQIVPCLPYAPENQIAWPATGYGSPAAFGRTVILELDGDFAPDAVVVAGGVAVALFDVAYYDQMQVIPGLTNVTDVATISVGGDGDPDLLLVTDANGLSTVAWSGGAFATPQVIARGSWVNARSVRFDDLDGDGVDDIIGVSQNGLSVLTRTGNGGSFPAGPTRTLTTQVFDALSLNWDNYAAPELAVVSADGLHVYTPSAEVTFLPYASAFGCLARIRARTAGADDFLAWARSAPGGGAELLVRNGASSEGRKALSFQDCNLDTFIPHAMLAGNYDGDPNDELLLVHDANARAIVLRNLAGLGGDHFDPSNPEDFDIVPLTAIQAPYSGVGIPAFGQLDLDGPEDVLCPLEGANSVVVFRSLPYYRTDFGGGQPPTSDAVFPDYVEFTTGINDAPGELRLAFKILSQYSSYNRVMVKIWSQTDQNSGLATDVFFSRTYPLEMDGSGSAVSSSYQWVRIDQDFPTGDVWVPQNNFYVELRFQKVSGSTLLQSPKFFGGLTLPSPTYTNSLFASCFSYLRTQGIPSKSFSMLRYHGLTTDEGNPDQQLVGAYVPMTALPPFAGTPQQVEPTLDTESTTSFVPPE